MVEETPGNAELMRAIEGLRTDIRDMRADLGGNYVRKDVQDAREIATALQIQGLEDEQTAIHKRIDKAETAQAANRRLVAGALLFPLLVTIIGTLLYYALHH